MRSTRGRHTSVAGGACLQIRAVAKQYGAVKALDGVDLLIESGEALGLIGPNGSGKTTMIDCIAGAISVTAGSIFMDEVDITKASRPQRARLGISRTFQNLKLFAEMTVEENVAAGLTARPTKSYSRGAVVGSLLEQFGLSSVARERSSDLSYGYQRRVEMARALASQPRLLCLDEPAAGLNDTETLELRGILTDIHANANCTLIIIDHDMTLVFGVAQRVVVLDDGYKIYEGSPDTVFQQVHVVEAYLGS
jgi:ABC-type branched-subunit amino acid transport system ATPase component